MFVDERNRIGSEEDQGYSARSRYVRYDYESRYEDERNRTSSSQRDSLQSSLERPATRSRLERADDARYGSYRATASYNENNYDRYFDSKQKVTERPARKRRSLMVAYLAVALVAVIAVTVAVLGLGEKQVVETKPLTVEALTASAENAAISAVDVSAAETIEEEAPAIGGENYIMLKSGELVAVEIPEQTIVPSEEEKGFDKLCSWLNGVFGG